MMNLGDSCREGLENARKALLPEKRQGLAKFERKPGRFRGAISAVNDDMENCAVEDGHAIADGKDEKIGGGHVWVQKAAPVLQMIYDGELKVGDVIEFSATSRLYFKAKEKAWCLKEPFDIKKYRP